MAQKKSKKWMCGSSRHVLGQIQWNGSGIPQLALYRHAVDLEADAPAEVDILTFAIGRQPIRCDLCDTVKLWDVDVSGLVYLFQFLTPDQVLEFSRRLQVASEKDA